VESVGKQPLGRLKSRWENVINMALRGTVYEGGRWLNMAQDHVQWQILVLTLPNLWVILAES